MPFYRHGYHRPATKLSFSRAMSYISVVDRALPHHYIAGVPNLTRTLALIKPDAFARRLTGKVIDAALDAGLAIVAMKSVNLNRAQAEAFYAVHRERPFFGSLVEFMTSGTTVAMVLEGSGAVPAWRDAMGATDPADAAPAPSGDGLPNRSSATAATAPTPTPTPHRDRLLLQRRGIAALTIGRASAPQPAPPSVRARNR